MSASEGECTSLVRELMTARDRELFPPDWREVAAAEDDLWIPIAPSLKDDEFTSWITRSYRVLFHQDRVADERLLLRSQRGLVGHP